MSKKILVGVIVVLALLLGVIAGGFGVYVLTMNKGDNDLTAIKMNETAQQNTYGTRPENQPANNPNVSGTASKEGKTADELRSSFENKLNNVLSDIDVYYYEPADYEALYDAMLHAAVDSLGDVYSTYYSPDEYASLLESASGIYSGIGATISQDRQTKVMTVVKPFMDSPAYKSGILPGDILVGVDGEDVVGEDLNNVVARIKGLAGTEVRITFIRDGREIVIPVIRDTIEIEYVTHRMLDSEVGYIMVSEFEDTTAKQFEEAIGDLFNKGMKALVVDLRDNPGGLYNIVIEMLDRIAPKNSLLVYTVDKYGHREYQYASTKATLDIPIAVLVNGNSASASEIFAGAVQDLELGTIIGTQSFGKGIVQSIIPVITDDISGIKLTSSHYYTPGGVCIHGIGITPDIIVELDEGLEKQLIEEREHDNQIDAAAAELRKQLGH